MTEIKFPSIKDLASNLEIKYNKSLGQNFIFDLDITSRITSFAGNIKDKIIVEIGPGLGSLTRPILYAQPKKCIALEKDDFLASQLTYLTTKYNNLEIINIDALDFDFAELAKQHDSKIYLIANLPYNISSQILYKIFSCQESIELMILMFQKEVAKRITAEKGSKEYGKLSVLCQYLFEVNELMELAPEVFTPAPKVYSSVVSFVPKKNIDIGVYYKLNKLLTEAFKAKRKMLKNNLSSYFKEPEETLNLCQIDGKARAEDVSLEQYLKLLEQIL
jgi:16S rRNA (adenine1518-N6/adenine1519-N6)-dimethyltransferase